MTAYPLHFALPENLSAKKFFKQLSKYSDYQIADQQYTIKTFYDSFDWRLYRTNMICEFNHSQVTSVLILSNKENGNLECVEEMQEVPQFSQQFKDGEMKQRLAPVLEMRSLLPVCQLPLETYQINILNKDQKTVLRVLFDEHELLTNHISLYPLKGYDKATSKMLDFLQKKLALVPSNNSVLKAALKLQGHKPKDYSSKFNIKLKPEMTADLASKTIFLHLLKTMQTNEAGTIADIDSEFLHDYRIAVRRTRTGLNQIKNTLPPAIVAQHAGFFAWLGQITSPTRDLDVYLLDYKKFKAVLPISIREDLTPLYDFLKTKQVQAQKEMANKLSSPEYRKQLADWEYYLNQPVPKKSQSGESKVPVKQMADQRIWKLYNRVIKEASAITPASPAEALHDLRKTCKKLRYLIEFFHSLYPEEQIKQILKTLKGFQNVLGDFQDYETQEMFIKQISQDMMAQNRPTNTFLAMGVLVQYLDSRKISARDDFAEQFKLFNQTKNHILFKSLFVNKS